MRKKLETGGEVPAYSLKSFMKKHFSRSSGPGNERV